MADPRLDPPRSMPTYAVRAPLVHWLREQANDAYADWDGLRTVLAYAVYRAAQDRADAAQDDLAKFARRLAA